MGNIKYSVNGKLHNAMELIALYEGNSQFCRNQRWNVLLSTDLSMSFVRAFEVYQIRWNIEVLNKECKQYLGLGACAGRNFDEQTADCTLSFLTFITMALEKRFSEYETMGELFENMEEDLMALTLWKPSAILHKASFGSSLRASWCYH